MPTGFHGDPRLKTPSWRAIVRHWQALQLPDCQAPHCLLPGLPIQYQGQRGPAHLDVGHLDARADDHRQAWRLEDTRPEHARCNRSAGQALGQARRALTNSTGERSATANRW